MANVINKIFSNKIDEEVHSDFVKFGKGNYENKYLIEAKKQKEGWSIKTGSEFANFFVRKGLERASGEIELKGAIISTLKLDSEIDFPIENIKQFMGVKQLVINTKVDPKKILNLMNKYPRVFFALTFSLPGYELKIKAKAPKSAKPASGGDKGPSADFCSLKTKDEDIVKDLLFDVNDFKELSIKHILKIDTITLPKGISDPTEIREKAVRNGSVIRIATIDGKEVRTEKDFEV